MRAALLVGVFVAALFGAACSPSGHAVVNEVTVFGNNEMVLEVASRPFSGYLEGRGGKTELRILIGEENAFTRSVGGLSAPASGNGHTLSGRIALARPEVDLLGVPVRIELRRPDGVFMSEVEFVRHEPLAGDDDTVSFSRCGPFQSDSESEIPLDPGMRLEDGRVVLDELVFPLVPQRRTPDEINRCAMPLAINEVSYAPDSGRLELEVVNTTAEWIDLAGWAFVLDRVEAAWSNEFVAPAGSGDDALSVVSLTVPEEDLRTALDTGALRFNHIDEELLAGSSYDYLEERAHPSIAAGLATAATVERCPDPSNEDEPVYVTNTTSTIGTVNSCGEIAVRPDGLLAINEVYAIEDVGAFIELTVVDGEAVDLEDWTLDTGSRVIELSRAGLGVLATEPGFMVLGDETAVADAGTVPALLLTDDEAVPSSEFFGLTLRQGDEVVDSVDFNNRVVDPAVSFQRCPADDGSGIFEIKRALDPSPGQANGCVEPARPECTDVCCESVGVPCDDFDDGYLKASNSGREDHFGYAVAVSGDTLAVGAPQESSNSTGVNGDEDNNDAVRSGAVYVFTRSGGRWSQQAYVKASNTGSRTFEGDAFGAAIALDGDTLVVGAPGEESIATGVNGDQDDNTSRDHGAAYVFVRSGTTWTQQAYLKASNTSDVFAGFGGDGFGSTVAIQGDTVVVGAFLEDGGSPGIDGDDANDDVRDSGAVYVFTRSTLGRWAQSAYIKSSDPGEQDYFGAAVALDGRALVVGAPGDDRTRESGGAAYVFERSGGSWAEVDVLESSVEGLFFGATVAIDGGRIAVGQRDTRRPDGSPVFFNRIGRVVLFERASAGPDPWLESATLQSPFVEESLRGAYNEFGFNSSVIEGERASHTTLVLDGDLLIVGDTFDRFGSGGLNGSRTAELDRAGSVFVFRLVEGVWEETAFIKASNVDAGDRFGVVAYDRGTLAIGAIWEESAATGVGGSQSNDSLPGAGAVYVRRVQLPEPPESP